MPGVISLVKGADQNYNFVFKNQLGDMQVVKIGDYQQAKEFMTCMADGDVAQFYRNKLAESRGGNPISDSLEARTIDGQYGTDIATIENALESSNEFVVGGRAIVNAGASSIADAIAGGEGFDATATRIGIEAARVLIVP